MPLVLIVDDHEMFAQSLVRLLGDDPGITVIGHVTNGRDGVARARVDRPDVVIMDFQLPDMDGASATRLLINEHPDTKVVILTGSDRAGAHSAAFEAGCSAWIRKTSALDELRVAVHRVHAGLPVPSHELDDLPTIGELSVDYQPIVQLWSGAVLGFEALVRWDHPTRGILPPSDFLPRAEETGFILDIGRAVMGKAAAQLVEWNRDFPSCPPRWMSVNISASDLSHRRFTESVAAVIEETNIEPENLVLEVTETTLVNETPETLGNIAGLKGLGVRLSLDDFGTGYASLSYLRRIHFDHIKIDGSFTDGLPTNAVCMALVRSIGQMAEGLGSIPIAEGVERSNQIDCLIEAGVTNAQGFYFARPADPSNIASLINSCLPQAAVTNGH